MKKINKSSIIRLGISVAIFVVLLVFTLVFRNSFSKASLSNNQELISEFYMASAYGVAYLILVFITILAGFILLLKIPFVIYHILGNNKTIN